MANRNSKSRNRQQSGNPARRASGTAGPTRSTGGSARTRPAATGFRASLERFSAPLLIRMHAMPRWIVPVVMGLLLTAGLFLSGPWAWLGAIFMVLLGIFLGWLFLLSWPVLSPGAKTARVLVVGALWGFAALKAMGRM